MTVEYLLLFLLLAAGLATALWLSLSVRSESRRRVQRLDDRFAALEARLALAEPVPRLQPVAPTPKPAASLLLEQSEFLRALASKV